MAVSQLRGSTIAIISAHVPGPHMSASAGPGPTSSYPKQCKSDGRVKIYNSVIARSPLTKSKKRKIIESTAKYTARVSVHCALTGLVPHANVYKADCSKNLQIENQSSSCQRWSLHAFQTSHFICDQFGCKLNLQSIQNHA